MVQKVRQGKADYGYNVRTDQYVSLLETGVIDPAKVVRVALENAAYRGCSHHRVCDYR